MIAVQHYCRQFDAWLFARGSLASLGLFRIATGIFLLIYWGARTGHITALTSDAGIVFPLFGLTLPSPTIAMAIHILLLIALCLFILGWQMRIAAASAFVILVYYWIVSFYLYPTAFVGLGIELLFFLMLSNADNAYSLKMRRKHGSVLHCEQGSLFFQRILAIHITVFYLAIGWQKIVLPDWSSGRVLYYNFQGVMAMPFTWWFLSLHPPMWLFEWTVYFVKLFQCMLPFALWIPRVRVFFFAGGLLFHLLLWLFLGFWMYLILVCGYILFLRSNDVESWLSAAKKKILHPR